MQPISHLKKLVSFNTQNPPRKIEVNSEIFQYISQQLSGFNIEINDYEDGCISLLATRGAPSLLFNFHIDTVPITNGWSRNPLDLEVQANKAIGLGACDIKGALACMLSAVNKTDGDVALLFTTDEEHGSSLAVKSFIKQNAGHFKEVIVAEPTGTKAIIAHRGIQTAKVSFTGLGGHASESRAFKDNANHKAAIWITKCLSWLDKQEFSFQSLCGLPFNIGKIKGGIKANMIADHCELNLGFRPLPNQNPQFILDQLAKLSPEIIKKTCNFTGPALPAFNDSFKKSISDAKLLTEKFSLPIGQPGDFWTEASLFSKAGITAIVYGPGNIEQAHTADEWVSIQQLEIVEQKYIEILSLIKQQSSQIKSIADTEAKENEHA